MSPLAGIDTMHNRVAAYCKSARCKSTLWRTAVLGLSLSLLLGQARAVLAQAAAAATGQAEAGKSASLARSLPAGATGYAEITGVGALLKQLQGSSYLQ